MINGTKQIYGYYAYSILSPSEEGGIENVVFFDLPGEHFISFKFKEGTCTEYLPGDIVDNTIIVRKDYEVIEPVYTGTIKPIGAPIISNNWPIIVVTPANTGVITTSPFSSSSIEVRPSFSRYLTTFSSSGGAVPPQPSIRTMDPGGLADIAAGNIITISYVNTLIRTLGITSFNRYTLLSGLNLELDVRPRPTMYKALSLYILNQILGDQYSKDDALVADIARYRKFLAELLNYLQNENPSPEKRKRVKTLISTFHSNLYLRNELNKLNWPEIDSPAWNQAIENSIREQLNDMIDYSTLDPRLSTLLENFFKPILNLEYGAQNQFSGARVVDLVSYFSRFHVINGVTYRHDINFVNDVRNILNGAIAAYSSIGKDPGVEVNHSDLGRYIWSSRNIYFSNRVLTGSHVSAIAIALHELRHPYFDIENGLNGRNQNLTPIEVEEADHNWMSQNDVALIMDALKRFASIQPGWPSPNDPANDIIYESIAWMGLIRHGSNINGVFTTGFQELFNRDPNKANTIIRNEWLLNQRLCNSLENANGARVFFPMF